MPKLLFKAFLESFNKFLNVLENSTSLNFPRKPPSNPPSTKNIFSQSFKFLKSLNHNHNKNHKENKNNKKTKQPTRCQ